MKRPEFVSFGSRARIKLSNITEYGITEYVLKDVPLSPEERNERMNKGLSAFESKKVFCPYLWIKTYQKGGSIFYQNEVDFDIYAKLRELDEYFK